ncbi:MAG: DUF421 domain-containing protein [Defluviitaleaceae bacterium]|nr:DUF421 domain-containing protein [Defluviitaleaceae bacterium]
MLDTAIRTLLGFVILLALTRLLGKKQLSQLTVFTYITGIALGSMASEMVMQKEIRIVDGVMALILWSLLVLIIEWISLKSPAARVLMDGQPTIVIKQGLILEEVLRKQRLNLDDLSMQLRLNQVFSVMDVEYAILEPNGALTVMKKTNKNPVTKEDMQIPPQSTGMPSEIITDGKIVEKNLVELGYSHEQLNAELKKQGVKDVKHVFYAELQQDRSLYIQNRMARNSLNGNKTP